MTDNLEWPFEGWMPPDQAGRIISSAPRTLGVPDFAVFRTVGYLAGNDRMFVPIASSMLVGGEQKAAEHPHVRMAGQLILAETSARASAIAPLTGVQPWLNSFMHGGWRQHVGGFNTSGVNMRHLDSHSEFGETPCWMAELQREPLPGVPTMSPPTGPFRDRDTGFFAESIPAAVAEWLGGPFAFQQSAALAVHLLIPDPRAYLTGFAYDGTTLRIDVSHAGDGDCEVNVVASTYDGKTLRPAAAPVREGQASITLPAAVRALQVYLTGTRGVCYDRFFEDERRISWGQCVLTPRRTDVDPRYQEFRQALDRGESETLDFKAWLPPERDADKSYELLKLASAFATNRGGTIYVGVTDELEVSGFSKPLREWGGKGPLPQIKEKYVLALRRLVQEGLSPPPTCIVEWFTHAGIDLLRIVVEPLPTPCTIVETGDAYVRRGASCKRLTADDLLAMTKGREAPNSAALQSGLGSPL